MRVFTIALLSQLAAVACGSTVTEDVDGGDADAGGADAAAVDSDASLADAGAEVDAAAPDTTPAAPNIRDFADCPVPAPGTRPWHINAPSPDPRRNLYRVTVDVAARPQAVCNDGTPAVYYVRAGSGADADKWHIHLQGGGGCRSYQECLDRWCSTGTSYDASKMSSTWAPAAMQGLGMFDARADNRFSELNHVFVYYCSSDTWSGQASNALVTGDADPYSAHFHGHDIVAAVIDELRAGATSDGGEHTLPSLDDATAVILSGSSAGGGGVRVNADWLGDELRTTNPDVLYRAIVDAAVTPDFADYLSPDQYQLTMTLAHQWSDGVTGSFRDQSCLDLHPAETWWCDNQVHVLRNHITTPVFVRMDLRDENPLPWVNPLTQEPLGTVTEFAIAVASQLDWLVDLADPTHAEEWADIAIPPGVFGPQCTTHTSVVTPRFFNQTLTAGGDVAYNFHDLLVNWLAGAEPTVAIDDPTAPATSCE